MVEKNKKEENINSLCKKYFTPELCDEPVTETKRALEFKLYAQLERYGRKMSRKYSYIGQDDIEDIVQETVITCFKQWKTVSLENYASYYGKAIKNNFIRKNKQNDKRDNKEISSNTPKGNDEDSDILEDDIQSPDYIKSPFYDKEIKMRLRFIDKCFRAKKRADWWKGIVTEYLYEDLHTFFSHYPSEPMQRYSFIDVEIYNWENAPTQKQVAQFLGKDEGQVSRALTAFVENIEELYKKQGNVL